MRFYEKYPVREMTLSGGKLFVYRYYKNPHGKAAIVRAQNETLDVTPG